MARRDFYMTPHFEEAHKQLEQSGAGVIQDGELHIPARLLFRFMEEVMTTISELSGNVDRLISVATDIKNQQGASPSLPSTPVDDPEVAALNDRIVKAIDVLTGSNSQGSTTPVTPPVTPVDPNAGTTSIDPNAPVSAQ